MQKIDKNSSIPRYYQLQQILIGEIRKRQPGDQFYSVREIGDKFKVSRATIDRALSELIKQGLIRCETGSGTFVTAPIPGKERNSKVLGLIIPHVDVSYFPDIARGIEDMAIENGYHTILCNANNDLEKEAMYVRKLLNQSVDGIIIAASMNSHKDKSLRKLNSIIPLAMIDILIKGIEADYIVCDNFAGACGAVNHLINLGHRRIAHLAGCINISTSRQRMEGYKDALRKHDLEFNPRLVKTTDFSEEDGYQAMQQILKMKNRITAVFAVTDTVAMGALKAIKEVGLKVPEDMALVGFSDGKESRNLEVPLTTVCQFPRGLGEIAVKTILERIRGERPLQDVKRIVLKTELIVRQSCGIGLKNGKKHWRGNA